MKQLRITETAETSQKARMPEVAAGFILHKASKACISILQIFKW